MEITFPKTNKTATPSQPAAATASPTASAFSALLQERVATLDDTLKQNQERRAALRTLQEMTEFTETVRHIMPDGTILETKYKNGKIAGSVRKNPRLHLVTDNTSPFPRAADGTLITSLIPTKLTTKRTTADDLFQI